MCGTEDVHVVNAARPSVVISIKTVPREGVWSVMRESVPVGEPRLVPSRSR